MGRVIKIWVITQKSKEDISGQLHFEWDIQGFETEVSAAWTTMTTKIISIKWNFCIINAKLHQMEGEGVA